MIKNITKATLGRLFVASGSLRNAIADQTVIVAFHRVNETPANDSLTVPPAQFSEFCSFFKRNFEVVSLAEQVRSIREGKPTGGTLSITFDDGYRDNFSVAAPILKEHGLPATFFVTTGFVQSNNVPFWDKDLEEQPGWMNWEEVRSLRAQGFEIGCHTHTHLDMGSAAPELIREELRKSRAILQEQTRGEIRLFAYPFGGRDNINAVSSALVQQEGFDCCVSCCGGTNQGSLDPFGLNRMPISKWFSSPYHMAAEMVLKKV